MNFEYDADGRLSVITDTAGRTIRLKWENGVIREVTDPMNRIRTYEYDEQQRLVKMTTPEGRKLEYRYNEDHQITEITDGEDGKREYVYNADGKVEQIRNTEGKTLLTFTYGSANRTDGCIAAGLDLRRGRRSGRFFTESGRRIVYL